MDHQFLLDLIKSPDFIRQSGLLIVGYFLFRDELRKLRETMAAGFSAIGDRFNTLENRVTKLENNKGEQ